MSTYTYGGVTYGSQQVNPEALGQYYYNAPARLAEELTSSKYDVGQFKAKDNFFGASKDTLARFLRDNPESGAVISNLLLSTTEPSKHLFGADFDGLIQSAQEYEHTRPSSLSWQTMLRFSPEITASLYIPMKFYTGTVGGMSRGVISGGFEGLAYEYARTGDVTKMGAYIGMLGGGIVGSASDYYHAAVHGAKPTPLAYDLGLAYKAASEQGKKLVNFASKYKLPISTAAAAVLMDGQEAEANPLTAIGSAARNIIRDTKYGFESGRVGANYLDVTSAHKMLEEEQLKAIQEGKELSNDEIGRRVRDQLTVTYNDNPTLSEAFSDLPPDIAYNIGIHLRQNPEMEMALNEAYNLVASTKKDAIARANELYEIIGDTYPLESHGKLRQSLTDVLELGMTDEMFDDIITGSNKYKEMLQKIDGVKASVETEQATKITELQKMLEDVILDADKANELRALYDNNRNGFAIASNTLREARLTREQLLEIGEAIDYVSIRNAFNRTDYRTKNLLLRELENNPDTINAIFRQVRLNRQDALSIDGLDPRDITPNYRPGMYKDQGSVTYLKAEDYKKIVELDKKVRGFKLDAVSPLVKDLNRSKSYYNERGEIETVHQVIVRSQDNYVQGLLPRKKAHERGFTSDIKFTSTARVGSKEASDYAKELESSNGVIDIDGQNFKVKKINVKFIENKKPIQSKNVSYEEFIRMNKDENIVLQEAKALEAHRFLTKKEKRAMGQERDVAAVASELARNRVYQKEMSNVYRKVRATMSTPKHKFNVDEFVGNPMQKKFMFIEPPASAFTNPEFIASFKNAYVKLTPDTAEKVGSSYVRREYAYAVQGYQRIMLTDAHNFTTRMMEDIVDTGHEWIREAISIKNPTVLVNNVMSGVFLMHSKLWLEQGLAGLAKMPKLNGYYIDSVKMLQDYHEIRAQMIRLEQKGLTASPEYDALMARKANNIIFEAQEHGLLKSMADDGIWDRVIRESGEMTLTEKVLREILLTKDSTAGSTMRMMHDISDMWQRIAMYRFMREEGMSPSQAVFESDKLFVNYDRILHPALMFSRDKAFIPFATWWYRSLPVLAGMVARNPMRAGMLHAMYMGMVDAFGSQDYYGGDYIFDVRVESMNPFNALMKPWDAIQFPFHDPSAAIPQVYQGSYGLTIKD